VRAYSVHEKYFVEVDVVVPPEMSTRYRVFASVLSFYFVDFVLFHFIPLLVVVLTSRESHDIGQSLQNKIEKLAEVERAFVHLDYECEHKADEEHQNLQ
jgi:hypothetical protein